MWGWGGEVMRRSVTVSFYSFMFNYPFSLC